MSRGSVPTSDSAIASAEIYVQIKPAVGNVPSTLAKIRDREPAGDAKRDALVRLVRALAQMSGTISDEDFATIEAVGYKDTQLTDIGLAFDIVGGFPPRVSHYRTGRRAARV